MIIFTVIGILIAIFFFTIIIMTVIEVAVKKKTNTKVFYKRDEVVTRTGGLAHDRNRSYNEIQNRKK
tara:strand:+ start:90 stop:290 length:201 start_codon:yes stop_codon:yes gene_type:complete